VAGRGGFLGRPELALPCQPGKDHMSSLIRYHRAARRRACPEFNPKW